MDIGQIESVVSKVMNVPIDLMHTKTRKREVVWARQFTMKYAFMTTKKKDHEIGGYFKKDRCTALHARDRIGELLHYDKEIQGYWHQIISTLPYNFHVSDYMFIIRMSKEQTTGEAEQMCINVSY